MSQEKKVPQSALNLAALIVDSKLLEQTRVRQLLEAFEMDWSNASAAVFASFLVSRDIVTPWQCEKLCNGQWRGFFLDHYRIDARIASDANYSYYAATDTGTPKRVILTVFPGPPPCQYTVEPFAEPSA
jgi:hypothetical protein